MSELSELSTQMMMLVAKMGFTGASREEFFRVFRGIRYADLEKEVKAIERAGYIQIEWVGPSNFTVTITPSGVDFVQSVDKDVWRKNSKGLEQKEDSTEGESSMLRDGVDYDRLDKRRYRISGSEKKEDQEESSE